MDKDLKKIFTYPFIAITSIVGFISAITYIFSFFTEKKDKIIAVMAITILSSIYIIISLYLRINKDKKKISKLEKNNIGLTEAKNSYLEINNALQVDVHKYSQENSFLLEHNYKLQSILKNIIMQNAMGNIDDNQKEVMINYILGGEYYGQKELESNKDNWWL